MGNESIRNRLEQKLDPTKASQDFLARLKDILMHPLKRPNPYIMLLSSMALARGVSSAYDIYNGWYDEKFLTNINMIFVETFFILGLWKSKKIND